MKKLVSSVLAASMVLSLAACGSSASTDTASSSEAASTSTAATTEAAGEGSGAYTGTPIKIGGIGPVTGGAAIYGQAVVNGAQLAVDEINDSDSKIKFEFQGEDDEADGEKSVNAYNTLMDWGMQVLAGPVTTTPTLAVAAESVNDNMFVMTPSASAQTVIETGDNVFQICFTDPNQGVASADYIAENALATKIGIIYDSSDAYSSGIYAKFKTEAESKGLEIVTAEAFTSDNKSDLSTQVAKCQEAGAELVFLPIYASDAATFLTQAKGKLDGMKMFGCDGLDGLLTKISNAGDADGVLMLTPFAADNQDTAVQNFVKKYQEKYNATPDQFAADGYDAVYTVVAALKQANLTSEDKDNFNSRIVAAMTKIEVKGVTGTMTWTADGESSKAAIAMEYRNGKAVLFTPDKE